MVEGVVVGELRGGRVEVFEGDFGEGWRSFGGCGGRFGRGGWLRLCGR